MVLLWWDCEHSIPQQCTEKAQGDLSGRHPTCRRHFGVELRITKRQNNKGNQTKGNT